MIAGVATSAGGATGPISTTRRVMTGGDQQIMPVLTGAPPPLAIPTVDAGGGPVQQAQSGGGMKKTRGLYGGGISPMQVAAGLVASRTKPLPNVL